MLDPVTQAKKAIVMILSASKSLNPEKFFGRRFDDLFERGDGDKVMRCMMDEYYTNEKLQKAIKKVNRWIGIDDLKIKYPQQQTLLNLSISEEKEESNIADSIPFADNLSGVSFKDYPQNY